eukprot:PhM_4_TR5190/c0_g1_i1/m.45848/K00868/pdxK, pdxY; pyridoxine kinase
MLRPPSVLSIQSHVVHGYVGNRAATMALQTLGIDVDVINTVSFSNHSGYPSFPGSRLSPDQFRELVSGLRTSGILPRTTHVLTGYLGTPELAAAVKETLFEMKQRQPNGLTVMCDAVCGDDGKLYVAEECVGHIRCIAACSDIVRFNHFELGVISGVSDAHTPDGQRAATDRVHREFGVRTVLVSDMSGHEVNVTCSIATQKGNQSDAPKRYVVRTPRIPFHFTGTGDLLSALYLGHLIRSDGDATLALRRSVSALYAVCNRTHAAYLQCAPSDGNARRPNGAADWHARELRLVQSRDDMVDPGKLFDVTCQP